MAPTQIKSVIRAVQILDSLSDATREGLSLSEISTKTCLNVSTAHHLIATLIDKQIVEQDPISKRYRLGLRLIELGKTARYSTSFAKIGGIHTESLAESTGQTTHLLLFHGLERIRILEAQRRDIVQIRSLPYESRTLYATGSGKVLLAHLPDKELQEYLSNTKLHPFQTSTITDQDALMEEFQHIRAVGYAEDHGEFIAGISAITAPVYDAAKMVKGVLDVVFPSYLGSEDKIKQWISYACQAAQALSQQLQAGGHIIS